MNRIICWYSHGFASLIAAKKAIEMNAGKRPIEVVSIWIEEEYHEPEQLCIVNEFLGVPVKYIYDTKYNASVNEVIKKTRYMSGVNGARCTKELKKQVRYDYQKDGDTHVFGMTIDEVKRIDQLIDNEPDLDIWAPLIELGISKTDCFKIASDNGIPLPKMYELGFHNNNCIGCVKASGAGYWNKIREHFPDVFNTRARQEELLNIALVTVSKNKFMKLYPEVYERMVNDNAYKTKKTNKRNAQGESYIYETLLLPLRYLPEDLGSVKDLDIGDCGFFCERKED